MKKSLKRQCHNRIMALLCAVALLFTIFGNNMINVLAAGQAAIEINGFQISTKLGGFRTVYSLSDPQGEVAECGMVYGLSDYAAVEDMVVNSNNNTVHNYVATEGGKTGVCYSSVSGAVSYAMTMRLMKQAEFYNAKMMVRAYAKLNDGSYIYSSCAATSVYAVADYLYNAGRMGTYAAHTYLYDNILSVVNPQHSIVDYDWCGEVVKPGQNTEETVTKTPEQDTTTVYVEETTTADETTTTTTAPIETTTSDIPYDENLAVPFGLVGSCPSNNTVGIVWGRGDIDNYNIYIDGNRVAKGVACGYYTYYGYLAGTHTVEIATYSDGKESARASVTVAVTGTSSMEELETTEYVEESTTVEAPETTTTKPVETVASDIPVDTSLAVPFGMVGSCPSDNTVGIVWGSGDINSYNVYIDGNRVAKGVGCGYYTYYGYLAGTHTVEIATYSNGKESPRASVAVDVTGTSSPEELTTKAPGTEINYDNSGNTYSEPIPELPNLQARDDRMYFKMNNKTKGQYSDSQIYWCILGKNADHQLCYVDKDGNLIPASTSMNVISKGDRMCADICYTLAEQSYVYMPDIESGRMYLSYGEQVYITFNTADTGEIGYAGPDLNNASDPNQDVLFEFIEFTITNKEYWGNTTRVDFYSFPVATRLFGDGGWNNYPGDADHYDRTVGDLGTREEIFAAYKNEVPDIFKTLVTDKRIMAPCKLTFNEGQQYANYYDNYINEFWTKYASEELVFNCDAGTFRGRVYGDTMQFTKDGDSGTYTIYKPTTQDVLEGKGNFNRGNSTELVIEAQLCAAFTRGVAMQPEKFNDESSYYTNSNSNFYSGFWHNHSYDGYAYGFCYDDVFDHSTLLHYTNPTGLVIDLKW